jgi:hypothetical protein
MKINNIIIIQTNLRVYYIPTRYCKIFVNIKNNKYIARSSTSINKLSLLTDYDANFPEILPILDFMVRLILLYKYFYTIIFWFSIYRTCQNDILLIYLLFPLILFR